MFAKSLLYGVLMWVIIFVEVTIIGFTPQLATQGANGFILNIYGVVIHFVFLVILALLLSKFYFKGRQARVKESILAAILFLAVGTVLDIAVTVPFFVKDYGIFFWKWSLWVGYGIFFLAFFIFCALLHRQK